MTKNKTKVDSYEGFEDFIEHFNVKPSSSENASKSDYGTKRHEAQLQLINFMELEYKRLHKLHRILTQQLPVLQESNATDRIIRELVVDANMIQDELINKLTDSDSTMNRHIHYLWEKTFVPTAK